MFTLPELTLHILLKLNFEDNGVVVDNRGRLWSVGKIDSFARAGYDRPWSARCSFLEEADNFFEYSVESR